MAKKTAPFHGVLEPITKGLPANVAAALGGALTRHAYLDWVLGQVMYNLMQISVKQGRIIMKIPRPRVFVTAVKDLFRFHGIEAKFDFDGLAAKLDMADQTRRLLTRSVYMRESGSRALKIHLARGLWDPGPGGETQPESQPVDAAFLASKREEIEAAVRAAEELRELTDRLLRDLDRQRRAAPTRRKP